MLARDYVHKMCSDLNILYTCPNWIFIVSSYCLSSWHLLHEVW